MHEPGWTIERLAKRHDRSQFDCGVESLNEFLAKRAGQFDKKNLGRTFVAVQSAAPRMVLGFYTLSTGAVRFEMLPSEESAGLPGRMPIPVLHLGRLAVSKLAQGQGLGSFLLVDALRRGLEVGTAVAMRAVEVNAVNNEARRFYLKYGFVELTDDENHLYLSMKKVAKLFPQVPKA